MAASSDTVVQGAGQPLTVFDVSYRHYMLPDGDDLYVTDFGLPFLGNVLPENAYGDRAWFDSHSVRLSTLGPRAAATSCSYKVTTKPWRGRAIDIVLKWNRMGQDIPGSWDDETLWHAEFNSPYEEFALLLEMRNTAYESPGRILTHKPLAIYVPIRKVDLDRLGRKQYKMDRKLNNHEDVDLDMLRPYAVIYEWIDGIDAAEAEHAGLLTHDEMLALTKRANADMNRKGFAVTDSKPQHIIVREVDSAGILRCRNGEPVYALIDFELLQRTAEREAAVKSARRYAYLQEQAHRFDVDLDVPVPRHLTPVNVMGVDYIYGATESTGGALWVVGRDPRLFDYFLPERWRQMQRTRLSTVDPVFRTTTKDMVQLVWRPSHVGEHPKVQSTHVGGAGAEEHGYNSPFEEVALSMMLSTKCIPATYPRAIYMSGHERETVDDDDRFVSHRDLTTPDGAPLLRRDRDYYTIWGYWNKPDEMLAREDRDYYRAVDALHAFREGLITRELYLALMHDVRKRLERCGVEDLNYCGMHILLSLDAGGEFVRDPNGLPEARICNCELLKKL